jgi:hypothetical protein
MADIIFFLAVVPADIAWDFLPLGFSNLNANTRMMIGE